MNAGTSRGFDVQHAGGRNVGSNGYLKFGGSSVPLWVHNVSVPFGLAGDTDQSSNTRTFYPRALNTPEFTVSCQSPNQQFYGDTVEFIRQAQRGFSNLTELFIAGYKLPVLRGGHSTINADGYIRTVERKHERFVYAPEFSFAFVVADLKSPTAWGSDDLVTIRKLKSWQQIVEGIMAHDQNAGFTDDPDKIPPVVNKGAQNAPLTTLPNGKVLP